MHWKKPPKIWHELKTIIRIDGYRNCNAVAEAGAVYQSYVKQMDGRDISPEQAITEMAQAAGHDRARKYRHTKDLQYSWIQDMVNAKTQMLLNQQVK
jgi:hypothetical protein